MDVKRYVGREMYVGDLPEVLQRAYAVSIEGSIAFYGDTVDAQIMDDQIRLCEATAEYIYSEYTPLELRYERGTRPELEKILDRILRDVSGERERVLNIMRFVRDLHKRRPGGGTKAAGDLFHGGSEEEVIKKASNMCNEQARVFCVLCQIAGIPARYLGHYIDRHGVNEAYVEGKWCYIDNEGRYFVKPDGALASAWELRLNPEIIGAQTPEVLAEVRKRFGLERTAREFCRVEVTVVTNYFVWESERYNYDWIWNTPELIERVRKITDAFPPEVDHANVDKMLKGEMPWPS